MKKLLLSMALTTLGSGAFAQNYQWGKAFIGPGSSENGRGIALDASENVYTVGGFSSVVDFDPGPGTYTIDVGATNNDLYVSKLDAAGNFVWAKSMGGPGNDFSYDVATDAAGNVYALCSIWSIGADMDPGPGTFTVSTVGGEDVVICKLDPSGNFIWAKQIGGGGNDTPDEIEIDAAGNIVIIGSFAGAPDMDPGPGTYTIGSTGGNDVFVCKLDASGNFVWAKNFGGTGNETGRSVSVDAAGNVYAFGGFAGTADFDPGVATYTLAASGATQLFVSKLDASGNFVWARQMGGPSNENAFSMDVDASGNVLMSGSYQGTADFNPGAGTYTITAAAGYDLFLAKLDNSGNFAWAIGMNGAGTSSEQGYACAFDGTGNAYMTGTFSGINDFDGGPATYTVDGVSGDFFIAKYDASGNFGWVQSVGSTSNDAGMAIAVNAAGTNIYATGNYSSLIDLDPGPGTNIVTIMDGSEAFVTKYTSCNMPASSSMITSTSSSVCPGSTMAFSTATVTGATSYSWTVPAGASITSGQNTNSVAVTFGSSAGTIVVTPSNTCGSSASASLAITVNALPSIGITSSPVSAVVCSGSPVSLSGTGATTYTWTGGISNGATFNPTTSSSYTVTGTDANGCTNTAIKTVTVNALPNLTVSASPSNTVCTGGSLTLSGTGATTYTWSGGITNGSAFVPTSSATYTVSGTDANGCVNTTTSSVVISNTLAVNATASNSVVCSGALVTLNGTGATTYTWSSGVVNGTAFTPTATASYTVTGTDGNGCTASAVKSITVNALPALGATTNRSLLCAGQTATITALGASTYTWSTNQNSAGIAVSPTVTTSYTLSGTGANGCVSTIAFTQSVSPCTGVEEFGTNGLEVNAYPNPNNGEFTIIANADASFMLVNALGELVQTIELSQVNNHRFTVEGLASGVYVLIGKANTKTLSQKIIVTN